ncbi:MAG TPA: preprotein translocase subunit SecA [Candidatus Scatosoma pullistercoris]|uniref:Protein translocase subunit SecA n=1 Tax=Candidatus Scatosoma pullistercoris TaxID=2840934 RepID=A0A9D1SGY4_9FIRM|nr:preprotein translocase subunit SecA [Candidatus Scatosoma pullistercoris]
MGLISYLMGSDGRKSLKKLGRIADKVEALESTYAAMDDDTLKAQTAVFKDRLAKGETTDDILPDAFAALREAAWRVLGMKHFRVQIIGGICLHQGRIAEMRTGEGKTLVATLPSYLNALTGKSVHVVTVNDYLARRDAEWMGKVHKFMGLTVGVIAPGMDDDAKREAYRCDIVYGTNNEFGFDYLRDNLKTDLKRMVQRDLSFAIVDEVDSILIDEARTPLIISGKGEKSSDLYVQVDRFVRTLSGGFDDELKEEEDAEFARKREERRENRKNKKKKEVVAEEAPDTDEEDEEEVDFTKMTLAEQANYEAEQEEKRAAAAAAAPEGKRALAASRDWDYIINRKDKTVELTDSGARKAEKFFRIDNIAEIEHADLNHHIQQALKAHKLFKRDEDYIVNDGEVIIVDEFTGRLMIGRRYSDGLHQAIEAKEGVEVRSENKTYATITFQNYFRLYSKLSGMTGTAKTEEAEFRTIYSLDVIEIPTNKPVKRVDLPDRVYSTIDGKKRAIVNEIVERHESGQPILVGTSSVDKSEEISRLLKKNGIKHNILNAKNHEREAEIVAQAGRFGAVTIATNMAGRGTDILLGGNPEYLAKKRLREEGVEREVIDLATSMYIQDIDDKTREVRERYKKLYEHYKAETDNEKEQVIAVGGLCIIGTERHESRRIDNQLRVRSGRQGDVGMSVFFLSLEDELVLRFGGERMKSLYNLFKIDEDTCLESRMLSRGIENAQKNIEGRNFGIRKNVLQYDDVMNTQRKVMYEERLNVLKGADVHEQVLKYIPDYVEETVRSAVNVEDMPELWNETELNAALEAKLLPEGTGYVTREKLMKWDYPLAIRKITNKTIKEYEKKIEDIKATGIDFKDVERRVLLMNVDRNWIDHIDAMDQLRKGIGLRAYGQVDPVISYKKEGFEMFDEMVERIQRTTIAVLLKVKVEIRPAPQPVRRQMPEQAAASGSGEVPPARKPLRRQMPEPLSSMSSYKEAMAKRAELLKAAQAAQAAQAARSAEAGETAAAPQADEKDADNK